MAFHFLLAATTSAASPVTLHILPHTHADVGWLQTVNSLSRLNVSRILDGVVATLQQDERRRFVWDEMAFLQLWWDANSTSDRQRTAFRQLVLERRIEMVDNGWSQHDMGCTTVDSMLNNWVEGHSWIAQHFGSEFLPRVGWSLDPFGPSVSQAVLQAMMGMDAWFFTRITGSDVDARKEAKALEFVWRGSSSLPHEETEIFSHVFESYYCMPHEYQFEWWADAIPNASTIVSRSWALANLTLERAAWFRTPNVLIPWGCDYMYQNAPLTFGSTEWLIDTINNHTTEWGVVAKFVTASEYVDAVLASAAASARDATAAVAPAPSFGLPVEASAELAAGNLSEAAQAANVSFPTVKNGSTFFPYEDWSGYFTSRPYLKGLSQRVHTALSAAEQLFGLHGSALDASSRRKLYARLETARRNGAIYQHHDAITGTFCAYAEGCAGEDQDVGSHDVLGSYEYMLEAALDEARTVFAAVAAATVHESGAAVVSTGSASTAANGANAAAPPLYFTDTQAFGDLLMGDGTGGGDAELLLYNPHAHAVVEGVSVPVPLCAVALYDLDSGEAVPSQTTATLQVNAGIAPSFDFELSFLAALPPLAFKRYLVSPVRDALGSAYYGHGCPASSSVGAAASVSHVQIHGKRPRPCASSDSPSADTCRDERKAAPPPPPPPALVSLENAFVRVDLDPTKGVVGVFDKAAGEFYPLTAGLVEFTMSDEVFTGAGPAYVMGVEGSGAPLVGARSFAPKTLGCHAWRQTKNCDGRGTREPQADLACEQPVPANVSGYCECALPTGINEAELVPLHISDCGAPERPPFSCAAVCAHGGTLNVSTVGATLATGPVLHEAWLQLTDQHRERVRLWQTDDATLGRLIQFGHRVGVLRPLTELGARFTLQQSATSSLATLHSEDNGYELVPHAPGTLALNVSRRVFPSQASAHLHDARSGVQLSVALDRSHGVAALTNGSLDVLLHRRARPFRMGEGTVVLDDTDRLFTRTWLAVGPQQEANRLRIAGKLRLHHPAALAFAAVASNASSLLRSRRDVTRRADSSSSRRATEAALAGRALAAELPPPVHLQSVRAAVPNGSTVLVRLRHMYGAHEDASYSAPVQVDLAQFLAAALPSSAVVAGAPRPMALDGFRPSEEARRMRRRLPTQASTTASEEAGLATAADSPSTTMVTLRPMELKTFQVDLR